MNKDLSNVSDILDGLWHISKKFILTIYTFPSELNFSCKVVFK